MSRPWRWTRRASQSVWAGEAQTNLDQAYVQNAMQAVLLDLDFSNVVTEEGEAYVNAKTG